MHSKLGRRAFCRVNPSGKNKYAHSEMSRNDTTLWAKQMVSTTKSSERDKRLTTNLQSLDTASKLALPNEMTFNHPATKKPRTMHPTPDLEAHAPINITPTSGAASSAMQVTCLKSDPMSSAPGPSCTARVSDIFSDIKPLSALGPSRPPPTPHSLQLITPLDRSKASRFPTLREVLSLINLEESVDNLVYTDMHSELEDFGMNDAMDVHSMPVELPPVKQEEPRDSEESNSDEFDSEVEKEEFMVEWLDGVQSCEQVPENVEPLATDVESEDGNDGNGEDMGTPQSRRSSSHEV